MRNVCSYFRKRSRENDEFDFPLSKRINNLNISNNVTFHHEAFAVTQIPLSNEPKPNEDNPFYHQSNQLLHELHMERSQRDSQRAIPRV